MEKTTQRLALKNNEGNKIEKNEILWTCSMHVLEKKNKCNCSRRKPRKESLGRPRHKRKNGVDMILK